MIAKLRQWWRTYGFLVIYYGPIDDLSFGPYVFKIALRSYRIGHAIGIHFYTCKYSKEADWYTFRTTRKIALHHSTKKNPMSYSERVIWERKCYG